MRVLNVREVKSVGGGLTPQETHILINEAIDALTDLPWFSQAFDFCPTEFGISFCPTVYLTGTSAPAGEPTPEEMQLLSCARGASGFSLSNPPANAMEAPVACIQVMMETCHQMKRDGHIDLEP